MSNQYLKLRRSSVPGKTPDTASLDFGEIALNTYDGLAFMKKSGSAGIEIVTLGSGGSNINTGSFATTGSNTFTGVQTISGSNGILKYSGNAALVNPSSPTLADIHTADDTPWLERFYNDSHSATNAAMAYFAWNDGRFVFHNESNQSIGLQVNGYNAENGLLVYPDKVAFVNNIEITGSIKAPSITGSLFGTASLALQVSTSISTQNLQHNVLFVDTSGPGYIQVDGGLRYNPNQDLLTTTASFALTASSADNFTVRGTLTAQTIVAQTITASTEFITGSSRFGSLSTNTHQFTGSVSMTGSLAVNNSLAVTGSLNISGSAGTILFTTNTDTLLLTGSAIITGSVAVTGSLSVLGSIIGSLTGIATTASYVLQAVSASFASTASSADNFLVRGTLTAQTIVAQVITSSTDFVTGSTRFGSLSSNTHQFTGSVSVTGSLNIASGLTTFTSILSGSQPANNPSSSLILISGSITPTGSLSGSSAVLMNTVMSASANNQTLVGMDINPTFIASSFTTLPKIVLKVGNLVVPNNTWTQTYVSAILEKGLYFYQSTARLFANGTTFNFIDGSGGSGNGSWTLTTNAGGGLLYSSAGGGSYTQFGTNDSTIGLALVAANTRQVQINTNGNTIIQTGGTFTDNGYKVQISGSGAASGSLFIDGLTTHTGNISGSQPANNPSSSLILISGSITPTGSLSGASAILMNTVMSASANSQTLVGLDINPTFNNGSFTGVGNIGLRYTLTGGTAFFLNNGNTRIGNSTNYINYGATLDIVGSGGIFFATTSGYSIKLTNTNNLLLQNGGTFTDNGYRLQVSGSGAASGSLYVNGSSLLSGSLNVIGNTNITGSLLLSTGSMFGLPTTSSTAPVTGSMYFSGSLLFIYNGTRYMSASFV